MDQKTEIFIIGKLGEKVLIVNKNDIPYIGKERSLEVYCIEVDLEHGIIFPVWQLELHLKFNPWEKTTEQDRANLLQYINCRFSDKDILQLIMLPLTEKQIQ